MLRLYELKLDYATRFKSKIKRIPNSFCQSTEVSLTLGLFLRKLKN